MGNSGKKEKENCDVNISIVFCINDQVEVNVEEFFRLINLRQNH